MKLSFEDKAEAIDLELQKRRGKWQLNSIAYLDFDDICQIIRRHIYLKWDLWDQSRPLEKWLNRVITRQLINLVRNHYGNVAPPCSGCAFNLWGEHCEFTGSGLKCPECPLYAAWSKSKQNGYNIKMAGSIHSEDYVERRSSALSFDGSVNVEKYIPGFHKIMEKKLRPKAFVVYRALYIDHLEASEVLKGIEAKNKESKIKKLNAVKRGIIKVAKEVLEDHDIFSLNED